VPTALVVRRRVGCLAGSVVDDAPTAHLRPPIQHIDILRCNARGAQTEGQSLPEGAVSCDYLTSPEPTRLSARELVRARTVVDHDTARAVGMLIEGLIMDRMLSTAPSWREQTPMTVTRIMARADAPSALTPSRSRG
jgi:hypothetical protein